MKRIILSVLALATTGVATAQEAYSLWSVTPKAGLTVASVLGDDTQDCSSSVSWAAGAEASLRPGRLLSFDFGLFYTRDRIKKDVQIHLPSPEFDRAAAAMRSTISTPTTKAASSPLPTRTATTCSVLPTMLGGGRPCSRTTSPSSAATPVTRWWRRAASST